MDHASDTPVSAPVGHELRFMSLHHPGRGLAVPCDATGRVDMDRLSDRLRDAYLGARARMGRDFAYPVVRALH